ncbi:MAG TPA: hypothetical protein VHV30_06640 [Polyangiaceae bacterium]|jgi:hypothetical protein|nr:hypothetical protein [Polyangiaceae bacterium]
MRLPRRRPRARPSSRLGRAAALAAFAALSTAAGTAWGETKPPVVIWPTLTPAGDAPAAGPLHKPQPAPDREAFARAQELDATLRDAVQDLGFDLYVADAGPAAGHTRDQDLVERAGSSAASGAPDGGTWVVSPRIESAGSGEYVVRIVVVAPQGRELRVRVETVQGDSVSVRGLVMLRDLLSPNAAAQAASEQAREEAAKGSANGIMRPPRSEGRAVLAVNAALYGGFTAFSLQRASGSEDPRVLYPLLALGTGIGIGGALLIADEWNISQGDAWFLSAGGWWGAASGFLLAAGASVQPLDDRYTWGVGGGLIGVTLATVALTLSPMDEGDAMLAHSGGALGLLLGGATQLLRDGKTPAETTPYVGMGLGTAIGVVGAGVLATQVTVSPSRVLLIDVGVGGGALIGAAAASPLIFQNLKAGATRGWLAATIGGSVAGGVLAWYLTRDVPAKASPSWLPALPVPSVLGTSATPAGAKPIYGLTWGGTL